MDVAYDHITEETLAPDEHDGKGKGKGGAGSDGGLNTELTQAYKALSASPWGTRLGAFVGTVRKQGESYYEHARKESGAAAESASKGLSDLRGAIVSRTRSLSLQSPIIAPAGDSDTADTAAGQEKQKQKQKEKEEEEEGLLQKLRKGAAQRIHEIEAAEARADEYLLKFGSNIGSFLRDAVTIAPPQTADGAGADTKEVLFEAKGGEKQIFTTRLDAQLHMLHTNLSLFKQDPTGEAFAAWAKDFSVDARTEQVAQDLDRYPELRSSMEKLVPDEVQYAAFWMRYYFLRNELDLEEQKRKALLKGAQTTTDEEVGWESGEEDEEAEAEAEDSEEEEEEDDDDDDDDDDEDDDDDDEEESDDDDEGAPKKKPAPAPKPISASTDTLTPNPTATTTAKPAAKPAAAKPATATTGGAATKPATAPKRTPKSSMDRGSESSYDLVSGAASKAPSQAAGTSPKAKGKETDDSDEDWE